MMPITTSPVLAAAMEKSMSGSMQPPGRLKAYCPSSAHAPSRRAADHRPRLDGSSEIANVAPGQESAGLIRRIRKFQASRIEFLAERSRGRADNRPPAGAAYGVQ